MNRDFWLFVGGVVAGAVGASLVIKHKEKLKPMVGGMAAKAAGLKDKALEHAGRAKEHAEEVVTEARHVDC